MAVNCELRSMTIRVPDRDRRSENGNIPITVCTETNERTYHTYSSVSFKFQVLVGYHG